MARSAQWLVRSRPDAQGEKRAIYADSAYRSNEREEDLAEAGTESQICEKETRSTPLTDVQKASNRTKSKVRARIEHVFGAQAAMGGNLVHTIGIARAKVTIGWVKETSASGRFPSFPDRDPKK